MIPPTQQWPSSTSSQGKNLLPKYLFKFLKQLAHPKFQSKFGSIEFTILEYILEFYRILVSDGKKKHCRQYLHLTSPRNFPQLQRNTEVLRGEMMCDSVGRWWNSSPTRSCPGMRNDTPWHSMAMSWYQQRKS